MRILFLDIDGVLNGSEYQESLVPHLVKQVYHLVEQTQAEVVISSAWRFFFTPEEIQKLLAEAVGMPPLPIIGETPAALRHGNRTLPQTVERVKMSYTQGMVRAIEIKEWLAAHAPDANFVVLDDISIWPRGIGSRVVVTDYRIGITAENTNQAKVLFDEASV